MKQSINQLSFWQCMYHSVFNLIQHFIYKWYECADITVNLSWPISWTLNRHSINLSVNQIFKLSVHLKWILFQSNGQATSQPKNLSAFHIDVPGNILFILSCNLSVNLLPSISQAINQTLNLSMYHSMCESIYQSISQSINLSVNVSVTVLFNLSVNL